MKDERIPDQLRELPLAKAPDSIWTSIEASLEASRNTQAAPARAWRPVWAWGIAAVAVIAMGVGSWIFTRYSTRTPKAAWEVVRMDGKLTEPGKIEVADFPEQNSSGCRLISTTSWYRVMA